jgi:hypothetical protein
LTITAAAEWLGRESKALRDLFTAPPNASGGPARFTVLAVATLNRDYANTRANKAGGVTFGNPSPSTSGNSRSA